MFAVICFACLLAIQASVSEVTSLEINSNPIPYLTSFNNLSNTEPCNEFYTSSIIQLTKQRDVLDMCADEEHDRRDCLYWGDTGGSHCVGRALFGPCRDREPNRGWKMDDQCLHRRDQLNRQIDLRNMELQQKKRTVREALLAVHTLIEQNECKLH